MRRSTSWAVGMLLAGWMAVAGVRLAWGQEPGMNRITQVLPGMTMLQVLQTMGPPSDIVGHTFIYARHGKVIFASSGSPLDKTKVEKVEPDKLQNPVP